MSETDPTIEVPEEAEKEAQGMVLAREIAELRGKAKSDDDYRVILEKVQKLNELFGVVTVETVAKPLKTETLTPLKIKEQYEAQLTALTEVGIYKTLSSGEIGFAVEGVEYPVPKIERVLAYLSESPEFADLLSKKEKQGFQRVRVSPFALPLQDMISAIDEKVQSLGGAERYLSDSWQGDLTELKYLTELSESGEVTGGKIKADILADPEKHPFVLDGYIISVVEEGDNLPVKSDSPKPIGGRTRLKGGEKGTEYLKKFNDPKSEYFGEDPSVLPEEWLALFSEALQTKYLATGKTIDVTGNDIFDSKSASWFVNCLFSSGSAPFARWSPGSRRFDLSGIRPSNSGGNLAPRPALRRKA